MLKTSIAVAALAAAWSQNAFAVEIERVSVVRKGPVYTSDATFVIDLPRDQVFLAFTAFQELATLNPAVTESRTETNQDDGLRVTTRIRDCIALFCKSVTLVEDVMLRGERSVHSIVVPGLSDFASGETNWEFRSIGSKTHVRYRSEMQPNFWLPPLLGSRALRKGLRRQIETTAGNLEATAPNAPSPGQ